ncbi:hypothetical protein KC19_VG125300 [Ceratodon purpureus]|uniref:Uncharacterized protein n=1 Tax=Ceratodon purpureus TaxID=3225 RepID=A0A8T0HPC5_CERPU|nr:hypothetical protein KC19_VG125300 [Ceratodon purpureus]
MRTLNPYALVWRRELRLPCRALPSLWCRLVEPLLPPPRTGVSALILPSPPASSSASRWSPSPWKMCVFISVVRKSRIFYMSFQQSSLVACRCRQSCLSSENCPLQLQLLDRGSNNNCTACNRATTFVVVPSKRHCSPAQARRASTPSSLARLSP